MTVHISLKVWVGQPAEAAAVGLLNSIAPPLACFISNGTFACLCPKQCCQGLTDDLKCRQRPQPPYVIKAGLNMTATNRTVGALVDSLGEQCSQATAYGDTARTNLGYPALMSWQEAPR